MDLCGNASELNRLRYCIEQRSDLFEVVEDVLLNGLCDCGIEDGNSSIGIRSIALRPLICNKAD